MKQGLVIISGQGCTISEQNTPRVITICVTAPNICPRCGWVFKFILRPLYFRVRTSVTMEQGSCVGPKAVRTFFFRREEYVVFAGIRTMDGPAVTSGLFHHLL
jgi:hypothetical protein